MAFAENLQPFFDTSGFGVAATYNGTTTVNGMLDLAYMEPLGNMAEASAPVFTCAEADVAAVKHGDTLAVASRTYKVVGVEPDGTGVVVLRLQRQ
jgi:hypothetical protein